MRAKTLERLLNQIAAEHLHIDTLATGNSDRIESHKVIGWCFKQAPQTTFTAGQQSKQTTQPNRYRRSI